MLNAMLILWPRYYTAILQRLPYKLFPHVPYGTAFSLASEVHSWLKSKLQHSYYIVFSQNYSYSIRCITDSGGFLHIYQTLILLCRILFRCIRVLRASTLVMSTHVSETAGTDQYAVCLVLN